MKEVEIGDINSLDGVRVVRSDDEPEEVTALAPTTLFANSDPVAILERSVQIADTLARFVRERKLTSTIQGREFVRMEGWTFLGSLLGVFPVCVETTQIEGGFEARVEAKTRDGAIVGAAVARCTRGEKTWSGRDDYALLSMAQTRATSKALRMPLGYIMQLAGFDPTPSEEMPEIATPVTHISEGVRGADKPATPQAPPPPISLPRAQFLAAEYGRKFPERAKSQELRIADARSATGNTALASFKSMTRADAEVFEKWLAEQEAPVTGGVAPAGMPDAAPPREPKAALSPRELKAREQRIIGFAMAAHTYDPSFRTVNIDAPLAEVLGYPGPGSVSVASLAQEAKYEDVVLPYLSGQAERAKPGLADDAASSLPF